MALDSPNTVERLRKDIDRGLTGDKVHASDPAAAPLGSDEEAAGAPVPPHAVAQARAHECMQADDPQQRRESRDLSLWLFGAAIAIAAAGLLWWAIA